jgi:hypothetical protein
MVVASVVVLRSCADIPSSEMQRLAMYLISIAVIAGSVVSVQCTNALSNLAADFLCVLSKCRIVGVAGTVWTAYE